MRDVLRLEFCGTVRLNRKGLPVNGMFKKKMARGTHKQMERNENGKLSYFTAWYDSKAVHMLSTMKSGVGQCQRTLLNEATQQYEKVTIPQPTVIATYNQTMGGTDSFDQRLANYKTTGKTKRWIPRVFSHFLNASVVNAFIFHKMYLKKPKKFNLLDFVQGLIFDLVPQVNTDIPNGIEPIFKRRRTEWEADRTRLNRQLQHLPFIEILGGKESDEDDDEEAEAKPEYLFRNSCVSCSRKTNIRCRTCGAYLCVEGRYKYGIYDDTCWDIFHTKAKL